MLRIYLSDLASYNNGALVGKWITLPMTDEELRFLLCIVLREGEVAVKGTNHEEYFLTDWDWNTVTLFELDEYEDIFTLNSNLKLLELLTPLQLKAVKFILDEQITNDIEDAILKAVDVIIHSNQTLEDVAYDLMQECYEIDKLPSIISNNIDYEGISRDLEQYGTYFEVDNDIFEYIG